jgi:hypothetical protein
LTDGIVDREPLRKVGRDLSRHEICPLLLGHPQFAPDMRPNTRSISSIGCCGDKRTPAPKPAWS